MAKLVHVAACLVCSCVLMTDATAAKGGGGGKGSREASTVNNTTNAAPRPKDRLQTGPVVRDHTTGGGASSGGAPAGWRPHTPDPNSQTHGWKGPRGGANIRDHRTGNGYPGFGR